MKKSTFVFAAFTLAIFSMFFAGCKNGADTVDTYVQTTTTNLYYCNVSGTVDGGTVMPQLLPATTITWTTDAKTNTNERNYRINLSFSYTSPTGISGRINESFIVNKIGSKYYYSGSETQAFSNLEGSTIKISGSFGGATTTSHTYDLTLTRL